MLDNKDITRGGAMTKETGITWDLNEVNKKWEEHWQQDKVWRRQYVERAKLMGESLDGTLVGVWPTPAGVVLDRAAYIGDPSIYKSNKDGYYFRIAGRKDQVARTDDPEEVRKRAKALYRVPLYYIGEYAIVKIDLERNIENGNPIYTPEGYIVRKRYNPETDPPIIPNQGKTPSPAI